MRRCYEEFNKELYRDMRERRKRLKMNSDENVIDELEEILQVFYSALAKLKKLDIEVRTRQDIVNGLTDLCSELQAAKLEELGEITKNKDWFIYE